MPLLVSALRKAFAHPKNWAVFFVAAAAIFSSFILVPVWTTPGNDIAYQWSLIKPPTFAVMIVLSVLNATLVVMHLLVRRLRAESLAREVAFDLGFIGSAIIATLGCASCYSSLLSVFGLGGVVFFGKYHYWISAAVVAVTAYAVWSTAKRIEGACKNGCAI